MFKTTTDLAFAADASSGGILWPCMLAQVRRCTLAALVLLIGCSTRSASKGFSYPAIQSARNSFALSVLDKIGRQHAGGNVTVSITDLGDALEILSIGSSGATRRELQSALADFSRPPSQLQIRRAESVWLAPQFRPSTRFVELASQKYDASVRNVNFEDGSAQAALDGWAAHTVGSSVAGMPLNNDTQFVVASVLTYSAPWKLAFDPKLTRTMPFHGYSTISQAHFMHTDEHFMVARCERVRSTLGWLIQLPYHDGGAMVLFLPGAMSSDPLLTLTKCQSHLQWKRLFAVVHLPRIVAKTSLHLNAALQRLGIRTAFTPMANFSPMLGVSGAPLTFAYQQNRISIDEAGTMVSSITETGGQLAGGAGLYFNRPFAFEVLDDRGGIEAAGQIVDLSGNSGVTSQ